ncbi:MAG: hypothetical protein ACRBBR_14460 [Cellvibrionaceae bacterium]
MKPSQNPFRSSALRQLRYCIDADELSALLNKIKGLNYRACIKGPHGTGKSTLLEDIAKALKQAGHSIHWHYINRQMSNTEKKAVLSSIINSKGESIHFLDGGEALGFISWNWLIQTSARKQIPLLATTHYPCLLPVLFTTQRDINLMLTLSKQLAAGEWNDALKQTAIKAYNSHSGNVREVFGDCYLHCASKH